MKMDFSARYYTVIQIDGDYAHLQLNDDPSQVVLVARALLPEAIREQCIIKYEMLQYEIVE